MQILIHVCMFNDFPMLSRQSSTQQVELSPVLTVPSRMQEGAKVRYGYYFITTSINHNTWYIL